tara:strand:- start:20102 stop:20323 length:222 start_codon:yes stop_codon:yes gene_type:complete
MVKANEKFNLSIRDIEIIEQALRAKAGRRGLAIANGETSPQLREELRELQELLGRIHDQKVWFRPKNKIYVSG